MSWRYRSYQSKFYFNEKEIDFTTEYLDYSQFLLQEFFTADLETRKKISTYYFDVYGSRSFAYLKRKYAEWANGDYHLTDLMKERILYLMPKFLNENAKHKLGIHEFMASIKNSVKSFQSSQKTTYRNTKTLKQPREVIAIFQREYEKIQALTIRDFRFNILTEEEKNEALEISKYILKIKLQKTFDQIQRDYNIFLPYLLKFNRGDFSATFLITLFNLKVEIVNIAVDDIELPRFKIAEIEANSRFKEYSDKYLAYELLSIHKKANEAVCNSFLNTNDMALFFEHYVALSNGKSLVNMNSTFQGEGGVLSLKVQIKPLNVLKKSLIISSFRLCIYFIVLVTLISFAFNHIFFILLIFGCFPLLFIAYIVVSDEIKQFKKLFKEFKKYGKQ